MPDPIQKTEVSMSWLGIPMPLWNLISATLISLVVAYLGYLQNVAIDANRKAVEENKAAVEAGTAVAKDHNTEVNKKLTSLKEEVRVGAEKTTAAAEKNVEATQAIPEAAAVAAAKIVEASGQTNAKEYEEK